MEKFKYYLTTLTIMLFWLIPVLIAPFAYKCFANDTQENPFQAEVIITQEAIDEAQMRPTVYDVVFTPKIKKEVEIMEKRHFKNKVTNESDSYRIARLESELMGKTWDHTPLETRIRRLKLASQRTILAGTSIPNAMGRIYTQKRIRNDSVELKNTEKVGIIDGLLKVYAPEVYEKLRDRNDRNFEYFGWE